MKINRAVCEAEYIFSTTELAGNKLSRYQNLLGERKGKERTEKRHKKQHGASLITSLIMCSLEKEAIFLHICEKHLPVA